MTDVTLETKTTEDLQSEWDEGAREFTTICAHIGQREFVTRMNMKNKETADAKAFARLEELEAKGPQIKAAIEGMKK